MGRKRQKNSSYILVKNKDNSAKKKGKKTGKLVVRRQRSPKGKLFSKCLNKQVYILLHPPRRNFSMGQGHGCSQPVQQRFYGSEILQGISVPQTIQTAGC